jgi:cytochrome c551/c552
MKARQWVSDSTPPRRDRPDAAVLRDGKARHRHRPDNAAVRPTSKESLMPRPLLPTRSVAARIVFACAASMGMTLPALPARAADASVALYGCVNCHQGDHAAAPSLKHLADESRKAGEDPQALDHLLKEMREHKAIRTHQRVSDAAALAALRGMARDAR